MTDKEVIKLLTDKNKELHGYKTKYERQKSALWTYIQNNVEQQDIIKNLTDDNRAWRIAYTREHEKTIKSD